MWKKGIIVMWAMFGFIFFFCYCVLLFLFFWLYLRPFDSPLIKSIYCLHFYLFARCWLESRNVYVDFLHSYFLSQFISLSLSSYIWLKKKTNKKKWSKVSKCCFKSIYVFAKLLVFTGNWYWIPNSGNSTDWEENMVAIANKLKRIQINYKRKINICIHLVQKKFSERNAKRMFFFLSKAGMTELALVIGFLNVYTNNKLFVLVHLSNGFA